MRLGDAAFTVLDVETTGTSAMKHRITEIAMLKVQQGRITETYETLINPQQSIPPFIARYTGITNAMVFGKPTFGDVAPQIVSFAASAPIIVGHNVQFDQSFLLASCSRSDLSLARQFDLPTLCTYRLASRLFPKLQRRTLQHVADYLGIKITKRHRAMGDAKATAEVLLRFLEIAQDEHDVEEVEELISLQFKRRSTSVTKPRSTLAKLRETITSFPDRPGIYIMRNRFDDVIYIGKAKSLRDRVGSYFVRSNTESSSKLRQLMKSVKSIAYEEAGSELSALIMESRKIKELKPRFNTLERRYKSYAFVRLDVQNPYPKLEAVREPGSDGAEYYGPFRAMSGVVAMIEVLNRSFMLRECGDEFYVSKDQKPCFYYEIERCNAPCAKLISAKGYRKEVDRLREFLASGEKGILALVYKMMMDAAERLDFEEAQFLKQRYLELRKVLGEGERSVASLDANDFVIMTKTFDGHAEVFFMRYGRLVKQIVLTPDILPQAEEWFSKQLLHYYPVSTAAIPPVCGKEEIDEMRLILSWVDRNKRHGSVVVYIEGGHDATVQKLTAALQGILVNVKPASEPTKSKEPQEIKNLIIPVSETVLSTAKRLTLRPMLQRK